MKKRHNEEQIIYALKRVEAGSKGLEVCREMGISEQTLYTRKLKALVADLSLDKHILQEVVRKSSEARAQAGAGGSDHAVV